MPLIAQDALRRDALRFCRLQLRQRAMMMILYFRHTRVSLPPLMRADMAPSLRRAIFAMHVERAPFVCLSLRAPLI